MIGSRNFLHVDKNILELFTYFLTCATPASTAVHCTFLLYVSVVRDLREKIRIYFFIDLTERLCKLNAMIFLHIGDANLNMIKYYCIT
jgi:hypothetical protein